ncbi:MAG: tRNA dihydrouridine synthase DusB [Pseudomonadota bacterium]
MRIEQGPPVFLAPMAGITDLPTRRLVRRFGVVGVVSEMVASREMVTARPLARMRSTLGLRDAGTAVQIAGCEAAPMAACAALCADAGAAVIDINMGCPAKKVTNGLSGSALMRDLDHALSLIQAVVAAVDVPVTLKTRLGWDDELKNAPELARRAEAAGIQRIAIHGRTRCQFYKGRADWAAIAAVRDAVTIPVLANGDIVDVATARQALAASGADGVMIGRGAQGRPWRPAEIAAAIWGAPAPIVPAGSALIDLIAGHYQDMLGFYGRDLGLRCARKHLGWYLDDLAPLPEVRHALLTAGSPETVLALLADLPNRTEMAAA